MKRALLTFCFAWAMPAHADTTLPPSATGQSWSESCAARIDALALSLGQPAGARREQYALLHEDGTHNTVAYIEYSTMVGPSSVTIEVGEESDTHPDQTWQRARVSEGPFTTWFHRAHGRFAKVKTDRAEWSRKYKGVADECLKMGDSK